MSVAALRYVPEFRLAIADAPVPAALRACIRSVNYQTALEGADRVELALANENLRWLDHALLRLDNRISLSMGYAPDTLRRMFAGEIVALSPTFPAGGAPMLSVSAQDARRHLQRGRKVRWFAIPTECMGNFPIPDLAIAGLVALQQRLIPVVDPIAAALSVVIGHVQMAVALGDPNAQQKLIRRQAAESDYDFLRRLCLENGWEMVMDHTAAPAGRRLRFMSIIGSHEPDVRLRYGESLIDFTPRVSTVGQIASVAASFWVPTLRMEFTVAVGWDWDRSALTLDITPGIGIAELGSGKDANKNPVMVLDQPLTGDTAPRVLVAKLLEKLNSRLTATGSCVGDPRIQAGTVMRIDGVGAQFGGLYRVTSATHAIDSGGYRTSFELRKEIWFGSVPLFEQGAVKVDVQGQSFRVGSP